MLYELATGEPPFCGDDVGAMIQAHLTQVPAPANVRNEDLSPWFAEVLAQLLAKQPVRRFESAEALCAVIEQGDRSAWWIDCATVVEERAARLPRLRIERETRLHGRDEALRALHEACDRAFDGEGNTVFIEGEAGIGKTRLIDELLRDIDAAHCHVLYGSYPPSGGMGGLSDAILEKFGEVNLAHALAPYLTVTPSLVPTFAAQLKARARADRRGAADGRRTPGRGRSPDAGAGGGEADGLDPRRHALRAAGEPRFFARDGACGRGPPRPADGHGASRRRPRGLQTGSATSPA